MQTYKLRVKGRVQGVFYRYWVKRNASSMGVAGYAKNLPDGDVEVLLQGGEEEVKELIRLCWKGPPLARVDSVTVFKVDSPRMTGFKVL